MEKTLPKRSEVPVEMTWNLADIYASQNDWEADVAAALKEAEELSAREGHVTESAQALYSAFTCLESIWRRMSAATTYAMMQKDQDTANSESQSLAARAQTAEVKISEMLSFLDPEILALPEETLAAYFAEKPELKEYEVSIREVVRRRAHSLTPELEKLLASSGDMSDTPHNAFGMLSNADLRFPSVTKADGQEVQISNGRFVPLQMSADRDLRRQVFEAYYGRYKEFSNTWAALYDGQVKQLMFHAKARKYNSTFEAAVDRNNVSPAVCDRLISSIHKNLPLMHRYVKLRKKLLGVDELHMYDVYTPIVKDYNPSYTYEEAKAACLEALAPLGEEYVATVKEAFANRWIDVTENEGKRSGAYSTGVYGVHPYMLLNFNSTLNDIFTLIHEMGHSMHTWYSGKNQSFFNSQYRIFVAEVASTTNEILLLEYLLKKAESREEKAYLINHYLESFKSTVYRQTMFEEFERKTNAMAEEGTPLTAKALTNTYMELNKAYFGEDMVSDELIGYEWCRIPHFYYNFYVYQYATSFCASVAIAHRILEEGEPAVKQYLAFLSSGCTQDPVSLLKIAGVDLSTEQPIEEALRVFEQEIAEMEKI